MAATHAFYTEAMGFDLVKVEAAATDGGGWTWSSFSTAKRALSDRSPAENGWGPDARQGFEPLVMKKVTA